MKNVLEAVKGAYIEFQKVEWPTKKETIRLTGYVIGASLIAGTLVLFFDQIFRRLLSLIIK